jgi:hypothetical protein
MSPAPPAQTASDEPRGTSVDRAGPARWIDRVAGLLLAGSLGLTVATAVPSLLVAAGVDLPGAAWSPVGSLREGRVPLGHRPGPRGASPHRFHADDPDTLDEDDEPGERAYAPETSVDPDGDVDGDDAPRGQLAMTRKSLTLREQPVVTAEVVGEVRAGEQVTVPLIVGEWALVSYDGGAVMGWAKKSEIAIR